MLTHSSTKIITHSSIKNIKTKDVIEKFRNCDARRHLLTHSSTKNSKTKDDFADKFSHLKLTETPTTRANNRSQCLATRQQIETSPEVMTPVSEGMTSFTELSDVTSPDLRRTYQALLNRDGDSKEYLPLFTSTPSRAWYSREILWPLRDFETSTGESVILSDTEEYVDVVNA